MGCAARRQEGQEQTGRGDRVDFSCPADVATRLVDCLWLDTLLGSASVNRDPAVQGNALSSHHEMARKGRFLGGAFQRAHDQ